jgi:hypothetical protein
MWCAWDTDDFPALQAAFDEMNRQRGLTSALTNMRTFCSTVHETTTASTSLTILKPHTRKPLHIR